MQSSIIVKATARISGMRGQKSGLIGYLLFDLSQRASLQKNVFAFLDVLCCSTSDADVTVSSSTGLILISS